jgi:PAT family beta-lactamase induction signal transducer AmpG
MAYIVNFQKPFLFEKGISPETLGLLTSTLLVPFILKVALGALSDRIPIGNWGSRKPYMLMGLILFAASYFSLGLIEPANQFTLFWIVSFFSALGMALFDTCADGWAVDVTAKTHHGAIQSSMLAGKSLGIIVMSRVFGWLVPHSGMKWVFWSLGLMSFLLMAAVILVQAPKRPSEKRAVVSTQALGEQYHLLGRHFILFALYGVFYSLASFGTDGLLTLHLSQSGADSATIGVFGMWKGMGALLGALVFALVSPKLGVKWSQVSGLLVLALGCLIPIVWIQPAWFAGTSWGLAWGFQETAFVTIAMGFAIGRWSATVFALCMIFSNLGTALGEVVGGKLVGSLGFNTTFMIFSAVAASSIVLSLSGAQSAKKTDSLC